MCLVFSDYDDTHDAHMANSILCFFSWLRAGAEQREWPGTQKRGSEIDCWEIPSVSRGLTKIKFLQLKLLRCL